MVEQSNSEAVQLTWRVTIPEGTSMNVTYYNGSSNDANFNSPVVQTTLLEYIIDEYIESILILTVPVDLVVNQTIVECCSKILAYFYQCDNFADCANLVRYILTRSSPVV